ncbi:MAG: hypothetical protein WDA02_03730 [Saccharofermentanales bacterium]
MARPEQSMGISDLIFIVLRSWRRLIIFALLGAVLFAGVDLLRNWRALAGEDWMPSATLSDKTIEEIRADVQVSHPAALTHSKRIAELSVRTDEIADQLANSVLLGLGEGEQPVSSFLVNLHYFKEVNEDDDLVEQKRHQLLLDYVSLTRSEEFFEFLVVKMDGLISGKWIKELFEIDVRQNAAIHFEVTGSDKEGAEKLALAIQDYLLREARGEINTPYAHQVTISDAQYAVRSNPQIQSRRERLETELAGALNEIQTEKETIEGIIEQVVEERRQELADELIATNTPPAVARGLVKYAVAGAFVGVLAAAFLAVYKESTAGLIRHPEEFAEQLGVLYIGQLGIPQGDSDGKEGSGFDRFLESAFYRRKNQVSGQLNLQHAASIVGGLCADSSCKTLAILGDGEAAPLLVDILNAEAGEGVAGLSAEIGQERAITALQQADAALVLVRPRATRLNELARDISIANQMGKKIIGVLASEVEPQ